MSGECRLADLFFRFDPWSLLDGFRNKALHLGVEIVKAEAVGFETEELFKESADGLAGYRRLKKLHVRYIRITFLV